MFLSFHQLLSKLPNKIEKKTNKTKQNWYSSKKMQFFRLLNLVVAVAVMSKCRVSSTSRVVLVYFSTRPSSLSSMQIIKNNLKEKKEQKDAGFIKQSTGTVIIFSIWNSWVSFFLWFVYDCFFLLFFFGIFFPFSMNLSFLVSGITRKTCKAETTVNFLFPILV